MKIIIGILNVFLYEEWAYEPKQIE